MEDEQDSAEEERLIELSSIVAIFPELTIDPKEPFSAILELPINPEKPLKIYFQAAMTTVPLAVESVNATDGGSATDAAAPAFDVHELSYLPALTVRITLPPDYPAQSPPQVELTSDPDWVPRNVLKSLAEDCTRLWHEVGQDQVLYAFIDHVQQCAETGFGIGVDTDGRFELPAELKISLLDFDLRKRKEHFENGTFDCGVCLEPKKGLQCHRLLFCSHVFCIACLQDVYNNAINEGDIAGVKCLAPDCGREEMKAMSDAKRRKHDRTLNPSELLQIPIEAEKVQRYVRLKRKKRLEADKDTVYCPRQWCQGAARSKKHPKPSDPLEDLDMSNSEPEEEAEGVPKKKKKKSVFIPMSERLSVCEDCGFAFCSVCLKGWHGELAFCDPKRQAELDEEEKAALEYIQKFSTPCPTCNCRAQKSMGCNHMICFQCKTHFCYLCSAYLMPDNPYEHFNNMNNKCHMRLWDLEGGDGLNDELDLARGNDEVVLDPRDFESDSDTGSESGDSDTAEDFADFGGDEVMLHIDEVEDGVIHPPAQQRRHMHIEIINFAGNGVNQRIELPEPEEPEVPPPAPVPPRHRANIHLRHPPQGNNGQARNANRERHRAAPGAGQGDNQARANINALDRFLELALNDQEDEWDSDDLDGDDFDVGEPDLRHARRVRT